MQLILYIIAAAAITLIAFNYFRIIFLIFKINLCGISKFELPYKTVDNIECDGPYKLFYGKSNLGTCFISNGINGDFLIKTRLEFLNIRKAYMVKSSNVDISDGVITIK